MPFTLKNLKEDLEDLGSSFDGAPHVERLSTTIIESCAVSVLGGDEIVCGARVAAAARTTSLVMCVGTRLPSCDSPRARAR